MALQDPATSGTFFSWFDDLIVYAEAEGTATLVPRYGHQCLFVVSSLVSCLFIVCVVTCFMTRRPFLFIPVFSLFSRPSTGTPTVSRLFQQTCLHMFHLQASFLCCSLSIVVLLLCHLLDHWFALSSTYRPSTSLLTSLHVFRFSYYVVQNNRLCPIFFFSHQMRPSVENTRSSTTSRSSSLLSLRS